MHNPAVAIIGWSLPAGVAALLFGRSGLAASGWLWLACATALVVGSGLLVGTVALLRRDFLRYGREALTVAAFAKAAGRHARARFIAVSVLCAGLGIALAGLAFVLAPGRPFSAALATPPLALAFWALSRLALTTRDARGAIERLVPAWALDHSLRDLAWLMRPAAGWQFARRVAILARIVVRDPRGQAPAQGLINALEAGPTMRPDLTNAGPNMGSEALIRARTAGPVLLLALPMAVVAWLATAFLPQNWVPLLPPPGAVFEWANLPEDDSRIEPPKEEVGPEDQPSTKAEEPEDEQNVALAPDSGAGGDKPDDVPQDDGEPNSGSSGNAPEAGDADTGGGGEGRG